MKESKIILIRHGYTEGNLKGWCYGRTDLPLSVRGRERTGELKRLGVYPDIPDSADCYTSGMIRTEETFRIIYGHRPHRVIHNLKEFNFGEYECRPFEEIRKDPFFKHWDEDRVGDIVLPGGESKNGFYSRVGTGLEELKEFHRFKEESLRHEQEEAVSLVVCHGGVIAGLMDIMFSGEKDNLWDWLPEPGTGYTVRLENGKPVYADPLGDGTPYSGF